MNLSFIQKLRLFFVAALFGILFICIAAYQSNRAFRHSLANESQAREIINQSEKILSAIKDIESGTRGYVLTRDTSYLRPLNQVQQNIFSRMALLDSLFHLDVSQKKNIDSLRFYVNKCLSLTKKTISTRDRDGLAAAIDLIGEKSRKETRNHIKTITSDIQAIEGMQLHERQNENDKTLLTLNVRVAFLFLLLTSILGIGFYGVNLYYTARQKSLAEIRSLYDDAPCGYHSLDKSGVFTQMNSTELAWLGYTRKEVVGKMNISNLLTPESAQKFEELFKRFKKEGIIKDEELEFVRKDGTAFPVLTNATAVKDTHGNFVSCRATVFDIADRKKFESEVKDINASLEYKISERTKELQRNTQRFKSLIENINDAILVIDDRGILVYQSPAMERIGGYSKEETFGKQVGQFIHPDDVEDLRNTLAYLVDKPNLPVIKQYRKKHKKGHYIWIEGTIINKLGDENIKGFIANYRDITERKEAEENLSRSQKIYRTIASNIPNSAILMFDKEERYLFVDGEVMMTLGYRKAEMEGKLAKDVLAPKVYELIQPLYEQALSGKKYTHQISIPGNHDFLLQFAPLYDENGSIYAAINIAIEITEINEAHRQIQKMNEELEERVNQRTEQLEIAKKDLEAFSYSVSHDLRSPLRVIDGFAEVLNEDYAQMLDDEGRKTINVIRSNAGYMGRLIDNLLDLSRMGRQALHLSQTDMRELVNDVVAEMNLSESFKGEISIANLPVALCDHELMKQVWINLISNAVKYSGKVLLPVIEIGFTEEEGNTIYFVKDNGAGFDMQFATKLFGVFQRMHRVTEFEGTGVGLALVHQIISRHGGKIWVNAKIDQGATFFFTLTKQ